MGSALLARISELPGIRLGPSGRAPIGTVGFSLPPQEAGGEARAFMLGSEFAHLHPEPDGSLHMTLPEPLRSDAIAAGWAEPHPLAGLPSISDHIVLVYAPRDARELDTVAALVAASWAYARGDFQAEGHRA